MVLCLLARSYGNTATVGYEVSAKASEVLESLLFINILPTGIHVEYQYVISSMCQQRDGEAESCSGSHIMRKRKRLIDGLRNKLYLKGKYESVIACSSLLLNITLFPLKMCLKLQGKKVDLTSHNVFLPSLVTL